MTKLFLSLLLFVPVSGWTFSNPSVNISCTEILLAHPIEVGTRGSITAIKGLEILAVQNPNNFEVRLVINGNTLLKTSTELYKIKDMRSGTLMELQSVATNKLPIDAVFMEMGSFEVATAGPIPEGTHDLKISLALVNSNQFYKNPSPMTVEKLVFDCKATVRY